MFQLQCPCQTIAHTRDALRGSPRLHTFIRPRNRVAHRFHRMMDLDGSGIETFDDRVALRERLVHFAVFADARIRGCVRRVFPNAWRIFLPRLGFVHDKFMAHISGNFDRPQRIQTRLLAGACDRRNLFAVVTNRERAVFRFHRRLDAGQRPCFVEIHR